MQDSRDLNKDITTNQGATNDSCTMCPWLDRQPEGNRMLCILPGNCFWQASWRSKDNG